MWLHLAPLHNDYPQTDSRLAVIALLNGERAFPSGQWVDFAYTILIDWHSKLKAIKHNKSRSAKLKFCETADHVYVERTDAEWTFEARDARGNPIAGFAGPFEIEVFNNSFYASIAEFVANEMRIYPDRAQELRAWLAFSFSVDSPKELYRLMF